MYETERLLIRRFKADDWEDLYDYLSRENVIRFEPYGVFSEEESKKEAIRRAGDPAFYAVCLKETNKVIGNVYFTQIEPKEFMTWEIGYVFHEDYWNKGYAAEACNEVMRNGFEKLGIHRIIGECDPLNPASWKLMERLHMRREAYMKKRAFFTRDSKGNPNWHDCLVYAILDEEYKSL
ncbi:MAG: GNAT family N-acetyltransferase [bacterium]|nr:GNAT family N-acetyltransferase [bacterium]